MACLKKTLPLFALTAGLLGLPRIGLGADDKPALAGQINYAYANYLGTGVYTAADRSVQVYRLPFSYSLRKPRDGKAGLKLRLPVTLGFLNFRVQDIKDAALPDHIETLTFVPGIEFTHNLDDNWMIIPFADLGVGYDSVSKLTALVYGAGVKSRMMFAYRGYRFELFNAFLYAGNTTRDETDNNDFSRLETGLNLQFPLPYKAWQRDTAMSVYYLNHLYFNRLEFFRFHEQPAEVRSQNEVGLTFDTFPDMKLAGAAFSRIGLGYRFGNGVHAIRLTFGLPF